MHFYWLIAVIVDFEGRYHALKRDHQASDRCGRFANHARILRLRQSVDLIQANNRSILLWNSCATMSLRNENVSCRTRLYASNLNS